MSEARKLDEKIRRASKKIDDGRREARENRAFYWMNQGIQELESAAYAATSEIERLQKIVDQYERERGRAYDKHMTPFLTYELLTPETADPVRINVFPCSVMERNEWFKAANKVSIYNGGAHFYRAYTNGDKHIVIPWVVKAEIPIPLSDWPAVKQAIRELNEYYGEKEMNLKSEGERILNILKSSIEPTGDTYRDVVRLIENSLAENERLLNLYQQAVKGRQDFRNAYRKEKDRKSDRENISMKEDKYIFPLSEWDVREDRSGPWPACNVLQIVLTRKKPKVVVEWRRAPSIYRSGAAYEQDDYGQFYIVQFRVTGWDGGRHFDATIGVPRWGIVNITNGYSKTVISEYPLSNTDIHIGLDARDKWSHPVLLPESVYSRLDEITKALEDRANGGKG